MRRSKIGPEIDVRSALEPGEKPTLKTLSRLSGLAVATVSRALNDAPDISDDTKRLVRRIADQVGYVPNRAGVRLRTGRTNVIALLLGHEADVMNHTAQLISAISEELNGTQYHLIVMPKIRGEDMLERVRYIVETGSADGILMNQTQADDPRVAYLMEKHFPFVTHGLTKWADQHPYYDYDNAAFLHHAMDTLHKRGRKTVYLILPPLSHNYSNDMRRGAEEAARKYGIRLIYNEGGTADSPILDIQQMVAGALAEHPEIDAIFGGSPTSIMAATAAAEQAGHTVGQDIDIIGKEAIRFLKQFRPGLLVGHEDVARAGHFVTKAVLQAIQEPEAPPMQFLEIPENDIE